MKKKIILSIITLIVMILTASLLLNIVNAEASSFTADECVAWAQARVDEGWCKDVDGAYGCQCVDFIKAYFIKLGESPKRGNACDYINMTMPSGWTKESSPKPGDIFVQNAGVAGADPNYGHIGIVVEVNGKTVKTAETNYWSSHYGNAAARNVERDVTKFTIFIRPNFKSSIELPPITSVQEGVYTFRNSGTGLLMNYARDSSDKAVFGCPADGTVEQTFKVVQANDYCYRLDIQDEDGGFVNFDAPDGSRIESNVKITRWTNYTGDYTQLICFHKVGENKYVLSSALGNGVISTNGNPNSQRLFTQTYNPGDESQIWELKEVPIIDNLIYGIDVSAWQGDIDWNLVKETGIDYSIIRSGTTLSSDPDTYYYDTKFDINYINAKKYGLKTGAYFFCTARTREKIINCTKEMLMHIAGKTFDYPVYIDIESSTEQMNMGKQELTSCLLEALELIKNAGYTAGVYSNENWFNHYIDATVIKEHGYEIWIARYPSISSPVDPTKYDYSDIAGVWQYSDKGTVNGIKTEVDLNVSYKDYTEIIKPSPIIREIVIGDINNDGCIDITDLSKLAIALVDKHEFTSEEIVLGDLDHDSAVGLTDLAILRQYLCKIITSI